MEQGPGAVILKRLNGSIRSRNPAGLLRYSSPMCCAAIIPLITIFIRVQHHPTFAEVLSNVRKVARSGHRGGALILRGTCAHEGVEGDANLLLSRDRNRPLFHLSVAGQFPFERGFDGKEFWLTDTTGAPQTAYFEDAEKQAAFCWRWTLLRSFDYAGKHRSGRGMRTDPGWRSERGREQFP